MIRDRRAVTAMEYAVILAVMSAAALALAPQLGQVLSGMLTPVTHLIPP